MARAPKQSEPAREPIRFYSVTAEYGELSNFAPYPIVLKGKRWPTSEHYFQAQKFANAKDQEEIRAVSSPMIAARMGRDRKRKLRRDWERVKIGIMREAVEAKFRQHDDLRALLAATGDAKLIEHTENDDFWGDGGDGSGRNELGRVLMAVRESLARETAESVSAEVLSVRHRLETWRMTTSMDGWLEHEVW